MGKTIAIIPARGNSKRLPNKNIKLLGGLPLLVRSINYAIANSSIIDEVYVSTDSTSIKEIALQYGAKVIDRPTHLSGDLEPTVSAMKHVLITLEDVETIVLLQPTNPLRPKNLLEEAFKVFNNTENHSLFTVSRDYKKLGKIIDNQYQPFNYSIGYRSQDLEPLFYENGLLYITKTKSILEGHILGNNNHSYIVNHPYADVDIDTLDDFKYAEFILTNYPNE